MLIVKRSLIWAWQRTARNRKEMEAKQYSMFFVVKHSSSAARVSSSLIHLKPVPCSILPRPTSIFSSPPTSLKHLAVDHLQLSLSSLSSQRFQRKYCLLLATFSPSLPRRPSSSPFSALLHSRHYESIEAHCCSRRGSSISFIWRRRESVLWRGWLCRFDAIYSLP